MLTCVTCSGKRFFGANLCHDCRGTGIAIRSAPPRESPDAHDAAVRAAAFAEAAEILERRAGELRVELDRPWHAGDKLEPYLRGELAGVERMAALIREGRE